jgi:hypothetical protein
MNERAQPSENVGNYYERNNQATESNTQDRRVLNRRDPLANTSLIEPGLVVGPIVVGRENNKMTTRKLGTLEVSRAHPPVESSAEVTVYTRWGGILMRMAYCSVGIDPWAIVQNKIPRAVAEPEFTPCDMSYMSHIGRKV